MELTNDFTVPVPVEQAWEVLTDIERIAPCMPGAQLQEVEGEEYRGIVKVKVGPITAQYKGAATFVERDDVAHKAVLRAEGRDTRGQGNASATITATLEPAGGGTKVRVHTDLTVTGKVAQFGRGVLADVSAKLLGQFVACLEQDVLASGPAGAEAPGAGPPRPGDRAAAEAAGQEAGGDGGTADAAAAADATPSAPGATEAPTSATTATATGTAGAPAAPTDGPTGHGATGTPASAAATTPPAGGTAATAPAPEASATAAGPGVRRIDSPEATPVDLLESAGIPVAKRAAPIAIAVLVVLLLLRRRRRRRHRRRS